MIKNLLLISFFILSIGDCAMAQYFGKYPYKFNMEPFMEMKIQNPNGDSIHYQAIQCISKVSMNFTKLGNFEIFERLTDNYNKTWSKINTYDNTNNLFIPPMLYMKRDLCVVANKIDTVFILLPSQKPRMTFKDLGIGTRNSEENIYIKDSIIAICGIPNTFSISLYPSFDGRVCEYFSGPMFPSPGGFEYRHNKNIKRDFSYFYDGELKDGDSLWFEYNPYEDIESCECMYTIWPQQQRLKSKKYFVKIGKSLPYHFTQTENKICPGDSLLVQVPENVTEIKWYTNYPINNYFYSSSGFENKSIPQIATEPIRYRAKFFISEKGFCPMVSDTINFTTGTDCKYGLVRGFAFNDLNGNNFIDYTTGKEETLYEKILKVEPQKDIVAPKFYNYSYYILVPNGKKSFISFVPNDQFVSDTFEVDFTDAKKFNNVNFNLAASLKKANDTQVGITTNRLRPGFAASVAIDIRNNGNTSKDFSLDVVIDTVFKALQFSIPPTAIANNKYTWTNRQLVGFGSIRITASATIPPNIDLLGKEAVSFAKLTTAGDPYLLNNYDTSRMIIRGSYDPNDKQAFGENGSKATFIAENKDIDYLIRFQNKGTDTAFTVVVIDTIKAGLDISTYKTLSSSHAYTYEIKNNKILIWTFNNILLPDDKVNEPGSHGYIKFRIGQSKGNVNGNFISNTASIYFDFNPPVITNTETIRVGDYLKITGVEKISKDETLLHLYPSPAKSSVQMSGTPGTVQITDMQGKVVVEKIFSGNEVLDVENFASGIYFVKAINGSQVITEKLLIAK